MSLLKYQSLTLEGRDYERAYLDFWNSSGSDDGKSSPPHLNKTELRAEKQLL